jgi:hypothetical protein
VAAGARTAAKYFGIADWDDAAARREKVSAALTVLDPALQDTQPYLFGLLGIVEGPDPIAQMDPQIKKQRTLDAIKRIVVPESLNQPLIVIFEDLHLPFINCVPALAPLPARAASRPSSSPRVTP